MSFKVTIVNGTETKTVEAQKGQLISEVMKQNGLVAMFPCGGNGRCGRCRVEVQGQTDLPTELELKTLGQRVNQGIRLACMTRITGDCRVIVPQETIEVVTQGIVSNYQRDPMYIRCGAAIDIGTTTIAAQLWLDDQMAVEYTMINPQVTFGSDVISRIQAAINGKLWHQQHAVTQAIQRILLMMSEKAGCIPEVVVVAGNTAMLHLLRGENPTALSIAPFQTERLFGEWATAASLHINGALENVRFYLMPCISAFIGGDITAAILASELTKKRETALLVDIGTNGEMVLQHQGRLICCSTAAGPVFEGAQISCGMQGKKGAVDHVSVQNGRITYTSIGHAKPIGICGSGLVDAVAAVRELGLLEESGYMEADAEIAPEVFLTPRDIRMVQLAKSAICAGIYTLCETAELSVEEVETLYIAGGFGSKLDINSAAKIGMIPAKLADRSKIIGNAALSGASIVLRSRSLAEECCFYRESAEILDLSSNPVFLEYYMEGMMF